MGGGWAWVCRQNEGSFGFAKRWHLCRAKTNVPECAVVFRFLFCLYSAKTPLSFCRLFCLFTMNANVPQPRSSGATNKLCCCAAIDVAALLCPVSFLPELFFKLKHLLCNFLPIFLFFLDKI